MYYCKAVFCCAFLWAKGLNAKGIHKEIIPVYGGKCHVKRFSLGGKRFSVDEEVEMEAQKWLRQQSKDFYASGFGRTGKAMGQMYQCWWRIFDNFFQV
jgi:hypothetical protein